MAKIVEVEPREVPPSDRISIRYPAPVGTRALYRQVAKLEGLQHEVWIRDALWRAAKAALEKHGLDVDDMPDAHFPKPPRLQPRYDLSDLPEEPPHWVKRRKRYREQAEGDANDAPKKKARSRARATSAATSKKTRKKRTKTRGGGT